MIRATRSWRYPFGIYGRSGVLNVAEVPQECPPLLSAKCMGELGVVMDVKEKSPTIAGEKRPTQMLSSGHPALDAAEYDDDGNFDQEFLVAAETVEGQMPRGVAKRGVQRRLTRVVEALMATNEKPPMTFKVTELWTWNEQALAEADPDSRWSKGSAISLKTGFDLRSPEDQTAAWNTLKKEAPDLVVMAFPCSPWSTL